MSSEKNCSLETHSCLLADFGKKKKASIHLQLIEAIKNPL